MKNLLLCVLACCLASRTWAQRPRVPKNYPPVCRIGEFSRPFHVAESVAVAGASKVTLVGRATRWASRVALAGAHSVDTTTVGGTLRVLVEGSWPYHYMVAGKRQADSLHFLVELIPQDSTCGYTFSQLVLRTPGSTLSGEYLMRRYSPASRQMTPAQLEAVRTRFLDSLNALIADLAADMNRAAAKTGRPH